jgi:hypothetical protein
LGISLTNENSIQEEIKSRQTMKYFLTFGVEFFGSSFLCKNIKTEIHRTIISPVVLCETWSLALREERGLRGSEKRVLKRIGGPKWDKVPGE